MTKTTVCGLSMTVLLGVGAAACGSDGSDGEGDTGVVPGEVVAGIKLDTFASVDLSIPPLWAFCNPAPQVDAMGNAKPGVYHETCAAPMAGQTLPIGMGWGATTAALRDSGWGASSWSAYLDGEELSLDAFGTFDVALPDGMGGETPARIWNVIADKPAAGVHTLRWVFTLNGDTYDGHITLPAGTYDLSYEVTIVAP